MKQDSVVSKCNESHADIFRFIFINLFFLESFHGHVGLEITSFGTDTTKVVNFGCERFWDATTAGGQVAHTLVTFWRPVVTMMTNQMSWRRNDGGNIMTFGE